jgi:5-methylcytosine-specific restriction endonuclease McrA
LKKNLRIKNNDLLDQSRLYKCVVCKSVDGSTAHHVQSVGAGGPDLRWNLMPLCMSHHMEIHQIGLNRFSKKYTAVFLWLLNNNWFYEEYGKRWQHLNNLKQTQN